MLNYRETEILNNLIKGKKYNDTCIAELDFQSENGNWIFEK